MTVILTRGELGFLKGSMAMMGHESGQGHAGAPPGFRYDPVLGSKLEQVAARHVPKENFGLDLSEDERAYLILLLESICGEWGDARGERELVAVTGSGSATARDILRRIQYE